ncbi:CBS domain-containing protein [Candidatus Micrarchaeota archaeon]|nr:CBS domain-containing protein [Candidatus Micrarchaeota archaeon]
MHDVERIGKMRRQLSLTQKQLATLAGVSQSLIAKIESGKIDPAYSKVMQIIGALEAEQNRGKKTVAQIMSPHIASVAPSDKLQKAISIMKEKDISQLPVLSEGNCVGSLSDGMIVDVIASRGEDLRKILVGEVMAESYPVLPAGSLVDVAIGLLHHYRAVLVEKNGKFAGILTRADVFKAI